jgi:hypothetical protein
MRVAAVLLVASVAVSACGSKGLSREEAAKAIAQQPAFINGLTTTVKFEVGSICRVAPDGRRDDFEGWLERSAPWSHRQRLAGAIRISNQRMVTLGFDNSHPAACEAAAKEHARRQGGGWVGGMVAVGRPFWYWEQELTPLALKAGVPAAGGDVAIFAPAVDKVLWISEPQPNNATVEFEYRKKATPVGKAALNAVDNAEPTVGRATFILRDDGIWQFDTLTLGSKPSGARRD